MRSHSLASEASCCNLLIMHDFCIPLRGLACQANVLGCAAVTLRCWGLVVLYQCTASPGWESRNALLCTTLQTVKESTVQPAQPAAAVMQCWSHSSVSSWTLEQRRCHHNAVHHTLWHCTLREIRNTHSATVPPWHTVCITLQSC
jgi:hypothetical protein